MNSVPEDFDQFYGAPRPMGITCLMVFEKGKVYLYSKIGKIVAVFDPKKKNYEGIILEVIYEETKKTVNVVDLFFHLLVDRHSN